MTHTAWEYEYRVNNGEEIELRLTEVSHFKEKMQCPNFPFTW